MHQHQHASTDEPRLRCSRAHESLFPCNIDLREIRSGGDLGLEEMNTHLLQCGCVALRAVQKRLEATKPGTGIVGTAGAMTLRLRV